MICVSVNRDLRIESSSGSYIDRVPQRSEERDHTQAGGQGTIPSSSAGILTVGTNLTVHC